MYPDDPVRKSDDLRKALVLDNQGDWDGAHRIVQQYSDPAACRIHAYLHRKEGDTTNAAYWYSRAGKKYPEITLEEEWNDLYREQGQAGK